LGAFDALLEFGELPHLAGLGAQDVRPVVFVPAGDAR
jgi:hypothetical protein